VNEIRVKVADYAVAKGDAVLATIGLGSCVAILLHDAQAQVGGLAHILLPNEAMSRDKANRAKFATTAVPLLVEEMAKLGGRGPLAATIVGGASMFSQLLSGSAINMGERNVEATRRALEGARLAVRAHDTGGDHGRSVFLNVASGRVLVKSLKRGDRVL
jgi:chemotaxis protein CheD